MACVSNNIGSYLRIIPGIGATKRLLKNHVNCGLNSSVSFVSHRTWNPFSSFHITRYHPCSQLDSIVIAGKSSGGNLDESVLSGNINDITNNSGGRVAALVTGGGGREHALCDALQRSPSRGAFFCTPGNAGIAKSSVATPIQESNTFNLISELRKSKAYRSLSIAKLTHAFILRSGSELDLFIYNNLLNVYWFCGSLVYAFRLFAGMFQRDVISWNTMISGFNGLEQYTTGVSYFKKMVWAGFIPTQASFVSALVACVELGDKGCFAQVHCFSLKSGFSSDCCVGNSLLKGYSKLGEWGDLLKLSDEMCVLNEISVEILLRGYSQWGMLVDALNLVRYCNINGVKLSPFSISSLISLCSRLCFMESGIQVHGYSIKVSLDTDVSVTNSLISLYARASRLDDAEHLFDWLPVQDRDIVTWNSLIGGFAYNGEGDAGLSIVQRMLLTGTRMNESTFLNFLSCCAVVGVLTNAKKAHALIIKMRECFHQGTDNVILTMYCRSNSVEDAVAVFGAMDVKDMVSCNLMMSLYRNCGRHEESIGIFFQAHSQITEVDEVILSGAICSCSKLDLLELAQQIHGLVIRSGFEKASHVKNSILELYSRIGRIDYMEQIFFKDSNEANIFSWNTMLMGYAHHGLSEKSVGIWKEMMIRGIEVDEFSCSAILDASANQKPIGEQIHAYVQKKGLVFDTALMNSLLTMYSNCGMMEKAVSVFEEISSADSISWNAIVSGYCQNGFAEESINIYIMMSKNEVQANHMTFASIFMSCAMILNLKLGAQFHAHVIKRAFVSELHVSNSLITMYAKCGEISKSSEIFESMVCKDVITWNSMINALSNHGLGGEANDVYAKMRSLGVKPNSVTFINLLSACSRAGLVSEAYYQFKSMYEDHGIAPSEEHYSCMVDILCRAGKLAEAMNLIEGMPFVPSSVVWKTLLSACRVNGDAELGKLAAKMVMEHEPWDSSTYVLLSDLYASLGDREGKAELRRIMEYRGVKKEAGYSWIF